MAMEKGPNFKVVGRVEKSDEELIMSEMKSKLYDGHLLNLSDQKREEFLKNEIPKTSEEIEFVRMANEETNRIMERLGVAPYDIPEKNVHILKNDFYGEFVKDNPHFLATVEPNLQAILCQEEEMQAGRLRAAIMIFHEFIHMKSYLAYDTKVEIDEEKKIRKIRTHKYREGVSVGSPIKKNDEGNTHHHFWGLNEAITARQEKIYLGKLLNTPQFSKERVHLFSKEALEAKNIIKEQAGTVVEDIYAINLEANRFTGIGYKNERRILDYVCQEIARDTNRTEDEIHEEFLRSHFTGNILPIARLVESSFGKGSFRELGEMRGDKESAERTMENLIKMRDIIT